MGMKFCKYKRDVFRMKLQKLFTGGIFIGWNCDHAFSYT